MIGVLVAAVLALDGGTDAGLRADAGVAGIAKVLIKDAGVGPFLAAIPTKLPDGGTFLACKQTPAICFSPEGDCDLLVSNLIDRAKTSLEVIVYSLNRPSIVDALLYAKARKVAVRLVIDTSQVIEPKEMVQLKRLMAAGIPMKRDTHQGIMHMKVVIVDNREFLTGSFNFTNNASENNDENAVVWDCQKLAFVYKTKFEQLWSKFKPAEEWITMKAALAADAGVPAPAAAGGGL